MRRQDDSRSHKVWLSEECEKPGFLIIYYLKFHSELNIMEYIWDYIECKFRKDRNYSYNSTVERLKELLMEAFLLSCFGKQPEAAIA